MRRNLHCYHGEIDGKKKIAVPRVYKRNANTGEYDIYTVEMEKNEGDIKPKYVLYLDVDAVYNRRDFNSKKYKFNSMNFKDMTTLQRSHRAMVIELENKSAIYVGGKIVGEEPMRVEDGRFTEIARNYIFADDPASINKVCGRYLDEIRTAMEKEATKSLDENKPFVWEEAVLTVEDFGLEDLDTDFLGTEVYSEGLSPKLLGYNQEIGLMAYEVGAAENHIIKTLKAKGEEVVFGVVIYKDFINIVIGEGVYGVGSKDSDWKDKISEAVRKTIEEFKVKNTIILQQTREVRNNDEMTYNFLYVLKKDTIYNK